MKNATPSWNIINGLLLQIVAHIFTFFVGQGTIHSPENKIGLAMATLFAFVISVVGILLVGQWSRGFPIHNLSAPHTELRLISKTKHDGAWYLIAQSIKGGRVICIYTTYEPEAEPGGSFYA